jgi:hypothetical protein
MLMNRAPAIASAAAREHLDLRCPHDVIEGKCVDQKNWRPFSLIDIPNSTRLQLKLHG